MTGTERFVWEGDPPGVKNLGVPVPRGDPCWRAKGEMRMPSPLPLALRGGRTSSRGGERGVAGLVGFDRSGELVLPMPVRDRRDIDILISVSLMSCTVPVQCLHVEFRQSSFAREVLVDKKRLLDDNWRQEVSFVDAENPNASSCSGENFLSLSFGIDSC